jgi:pseudouridine-5'-monophosphatase
MDGLLLDTEKIYTRVTEDLLREYCGVEKEYPFSLKQKMMGLKEMEAAELLVKELSLSSSVLIKPQEYLQERNRRQKELFPHCQLMPGVEKMLLQLQLSKKKKKLAIATSSHRESFLVKTLNHKHLINDTEMFDVIVCGDDVKESKPNPAIFLEAMRRLGSTDASECLVFEDAVNGVRAALAGGFPVVWIPSDQRLLQGQEELMQKCLLVANSMEDLLV